MINFSESMLFKNACLKSATTFPLLSFKSPLSKVIVIFSSLPSAKESPSSLKGTKINLNKTIFASASKLFPATLRTSSTLKSAKDDGGN